VVVDPGGHAQAYDTFACGLFSDEFIEALGERDTTKLSVQEGLKLITDVIAEITRDAEIAEPRKETKEGSAAEDPSSKLHLQIAVVSSSER